MSIVINGFNYGRFLGEAIDGALDQTYPSVEVVVVDNGSTDDSRAIMEGYRLLESVDLEFLAILDADIVLPPDYYHSIFTHFDADPSLGVASGIYENLIDGKLQKSMESNGMFEEHYRKQLCTLLQAYRHITETLNAFYGALLTSYRKPD